MRVLVACEYSGTVRDAFIAKGHNAVSCDLLPTESPGPHYQGHIQDLLCLEWDLMIAHPPCTYLTVTGNRWFYHPDDKHLPINRRRPHPLHPNRKEQRLDAIEFFMMLAKIDVDRYAIENPVGVMSSVWRKPDQIIQPNEYGHAATKKTCLWLKGLPQLKPTETVETEVMIVKSGNRMDKWYYETSCLPAKERWKVRSKTFKGIAEAMADQWG